MTTRFPYAGEVALRSWAGVTWHSVEVRSEFVDARGVRRLRVLWTGPAALGKRPGRIYRPPAESVRRLVVEEVAR